MKTAASLLALAALVLLGGCTYNPLTGNPVGAPIVNQSNDLDQACVMDAIACYSELKSSGADPGILICRYRKPGDPKDYGHAMTVYNWPPRPNRYSVVYIYDRANASTSLPGSVNEYSALDCARFMIPQSYSAAWTDPGALNP